MIKLPPSAPPQPAPERLIWLDTIRIVAALMILLYHAQLGFTQYTFTPQPTGFWSNLNQLWTPDVLPKSINRWAHRLGIPTLFGFQFIDMFVLLSGFSLTLAQGHQSVAVLTFWQRRLSRLLWPFWTIVVLSYPLLWAIGEATHSYIPSLWSFFAAATFPLLADYRGTLLLPISGVWWFVPLIISFTLIFPFLHRLLQRWGDKHLVGVALLVTLGYRALAVYTFGGHPTYIILNTPNLELPFQLFVAKLSTFVVGMALAHSYLQHRGLLRWSNVKILMVGLGLYSFATLIQFEQSGWILSDMIAPIGLMLLCVAIFRPLTNLLQAPQMITKLGHHSYSFFLLHAIVVDRTLSLWVKQQNNRYLSLLLPMILGTLFLAILSDRLQPLLKRLMVRLWNDLDYVLTIRDLNVEPFWSPNIGEKVIYQGDAAWQIVQIERLAGESKGHLCKISDQHRLIWVEQTKLKPML